MTPESPRRWIHHLSAISAVGPGSGLAQPVATISLLALLLSGCGAEWPAAAASGGSTGAAAAPRAAPAATGARRVAGAPSMVATTLQVPAPLRQGTFSQDRRLQIQEGFTISLYASVPGARSMMVGPAGELLVTQPSQGRIIALRQAPEAGSVPSQSVLAERLQCPYGMALHDGYLYVAQSTKVERFAYIGTGESLGPAELVVGGLPQSGCAAHHYRPLLFDAKGNFYVAFGSSCNVCVESDARRGTVWQFAPDGTAREFARGLRNVVDLDINPETGELWGATNERDNLGDDVPMDLVSAIADGADYGWPYCYWTDNGWVVDTRVPRNNPECKGLASYNGIQAHSSPLGISFYTATQFPEDYRGSAFVGLHGSWNRSVATGYKVLRVPVTNGTPSPAEDFVTGWLTGTRGEQDAWGRPVDVRTGIDGALFVSDDKAGAIYRITYTGPA